MEGFFSLNNTISPPLEDSQRFPAHTLENPIDTGATYITCGNRK